MIGKKGDRNGGARGAILALVTVLASFGLLLPACAAQPQGSADSGKAMAATDSGKVVAKVMEDKVTQGDLEKAAAEQLEQVDMQLLSCQANAETQRHQVLEGALNNLVQEKIIAAEAKERGMTSEELVAAEVDSKLAEVTDADVDAFYTDNQARIRRPKDQVAPQIKQYLQSQRHDEAYGGFIKGLEGKYKVTMLLEPPRKQVEASGPSKGPDSAPITIVEFSDFQCPFCSRVVPTLDKVHEEYGDKVRLVFRQFPLSIHPNAQKAAEASLCARDQGKFWEMHDKMFGDQQQLGVDQLKAKAAELGLDAGKFDQCLDSNQYADAVKADMKAGASAGVSGTPAMFINGIFVSGAVPYEQVAKVIDEELARKSESTN